jgi:predicted DNA binding CopG/RHH family protein
MKRRIPSFKTDAEAERFVAEADLTKYDLAGLVPVQFEFDKKTAQLNMRLPKRLLDAVKKRASARGIPYTRFVREAVELALSRPDRSR